MKTKFGLAYVVTVYGLVIVLMYCPVEESWDGSGFTGMKRPQLELNDLATLETDPLEVLTTIFLSISLFVSTILWKEKPWSG